MVATGITEEQANELKRLALEHSNAAFDCGEWDEEDLNTYEEVYRRADTARAALHDYIDSLRIKP